MGKHLTRWFVLGLAVGLAGAGVAVMCRRRCCAAQPADDTAPAEAEASGEAAAGPASDA